MSVVGTQITDFLTDKLDISLYVSIAGRISGSIEHFVLLPIGDGCRWHRNIGSWEGGEATFDADCMVTVGHALSLGLEVDALLGVLGLNPSHGGFL